MDERKGSPCMLVLTWKPSGVQCCVDDMEEVRISDWPDPPGSHAWLPAYGFQHEILDKDDYFCTNGECHYCQWLPFECYFGPKCKIWVESGKKCSSSKCTETYPRKQIRLYCFESSFVFFYFSNFINKNTSLDWKSLCSSECHRFVCVSIFDWYF